MFVHVGWSKNARRAIGGFLVVLLGCSEASTLIEPAVKARHSASVASPEEVFRGVIFGEGVVADAVPRIRDEYKIDLIVSPDLSLSYLQNLHNQIIERVNAIDPAFIWS